MKLLLCTWHFKCIIPLQNQQHMLPYTKLPVTKDVQALEIQYYMK